MTTRFDPPTGTLPFRAAELQHERVLQVHLKTPEEPQTTLLEAFKALGPHCPVDWIACDRQRLDDTIVEAAREHQPTLVFMQLQQPGIVVPALLDRIREAVTDSRLAIAHWCGDVAGLNGITAECLSWQVELSQAFDLWLHSSWSHVRVLREFGAKNVRYLQIGYDEDRYTPAVADKAYDVAFLGQNYPPSMLGMPQNYSTTRAETVQAFATSGLRFALYGSNWPTSLGRLPPAKSADVYRRSHLGLNLSISNFFERYSSDRLLRIMGCGTAPLVERFPDTASWGLIHEHNCLLFETAEEAVDLARTWLKRPDELRVIGQRARDLALTHHTWGVRVLELLPYVAELRNETIAVVQP